jgi:hypothetical protein
MQAMTCTLGVFEGCVEEVSCGKSISTFFNMQVVLIFLDIYQMQAR